MTKVEQELISRCISPCISPYLPAQVTKVEQELGELKSAHEAKATEVKQQRKQLKQARYSEI